MKRKRIITLVVLLVFAGLVGWGYVQLKYYHGWKKIDLRKTWPKGQWLQVQFVEINFGEDFIAFKVSGNKLKEFESQLQQEIRGSEKWFLPWTERLMWYPDQLRITTTKGKYYVPVIYNSVKIFGETWKSHNLVKLLYAYGLKGYDSEPNLSSDMEINHEKKIIISPSPSGDPNFAKKLYPDPNQPQK